ncbi:MAG: endonuclease V [Cyanobacteria bacterium J06634_6]
MLLATDIQYGENDAVAAGVLFSSWVDEESEQSFTKHIKGIEPYEPGSFYKRELPCILALLSEINLDELTAIVIDGYVVLGSQQKPGLGMHLYEAIDRAIPVIGVAKNKFADTPTDCEILRGSSQSPLFVTSIAMPLEIAKANIVGMHGENRIPTMLKKVDQLCRGIAV